MSFNCALAAIYINLLILTSLFIFVVLPIGILGYTSFRAFKRFASN